MELYVYGAVNKNGEIKKVKNSKTLYHQGDSYLIGAVKHHNKTHPEEPWKVTKFKLVEFDILGCTT